MLRFFVSVGRWPVSVSSVLGSKVVSKWTIWFSLFLSLLQRIVAGTISTNFLFLVRMEENCGQSATDSGMSDGLFLCYFQRAHSLFASIDQHQYRKKLLQFMCRDRHHNLKTGRKPFYHSIESFSGHYKMTRGVECLTKLTCISWCRQCGTHEHDEHTGLDTVYKCRTYVSNISYIWI